MIDKLVLEQARLTAELAASAAAVLWRPAVDCAARFKELYDSAQSLSQRCARSIRPSSRVELEPLDSRELYAFSRALTEAQLSLRLLVQDAILHECGSDAALKDMARQAAQSARQLSTALRAGAAAKGANALARASLYQRNLEALRREAVRAASAQENIVSRVKLLQLYRHFSDIAMRLAKAIDTLGGAWARCD